GITLPAAMEAAGYDPDTLGPDPDRLSRIGAFVELHVEQGRSLDLTGDPVGIAGSIWPHGRWRYDFHGEANHAGTTRLGDRRDPMLTYAGTVLEARREAELA
ncbi:allantoate amidohydrolase, partial [Streptomyces sp. NRRL WC-3753]